ncbi:Aluminum-activated malate transporter 2-like protein [Drosera capensis]
MNSENTENHSGTLSILEKLRLEKIINIGQRVKETIKSNARSVIHSMKVGLAITIITLIYYGFCDIGLEVSGTWAVLTVVLVFEHSVGATLCKGLSRAMGTILGAIFSIGARQVAHLAGQKAEPVLICIFVFLIGALMTFLRCIPKTKTWCDYGLVVFILTFSLISISGYNELLATAQQRICAILTGGFVAAIVCVLICPVWAGDDLHILISGNIEKLGNILGEFAEEYFKPTKEEISAEKNAFIEGYKSVLNTKSKEDSLVNFAKWEPPRYQRIRYNHPWKHYTIIGALVQECGCNLKALNGYLQTEFQAPREVKEKFEATCTKISHETAKALKNLASSLKTMTKPSPFVKSHIENAKTAADLKYMFKASLWQDTNLADVIAPPAVASLLIEVVACTEKISEAVQELASLAGFENADEAGHASSMSKANIEANIVCVISSG